MRKTTLTKWIVVLGISCAAFIWGNAKSRLSAEDYFAKEQLAQKAALAWLGLIDAGDYRKSWDEAAGYLKQAIPREQWEHSLAAVRKPLGNVLTRTVKSRTYHTTLPGAPDGEYVVMQFKTSFSRKKSAVETVTPMKDEDGKWRVSGYYIK